MKNVAIVGSSGYISGFILNKLQQSNDVKKILKIDRTMGSDIQYLDLSHPENFDYGCLNDIDLVVFTAAISGPDQCAKEFDTCWQINVTGTIHFIEKALQLGCRILFFSSDAVYGDIPGKIYDEESITLGETPYGRMKKSVEDRFKSSTDFKAIRLSYVMSAKDRFVSYCLTCMKEQKTAEIFHPFYRNVIAVSDVVDVVLWLNQNWNNYSPTFLNVTGSELVSRVRIADELNRIYGGRLQYTITHPGKEFYENRPAITQMKSLYLYEYGILEDVSFTQKLSKELEEINL